MYFIRGCGAKPHLYDAGPSSLENIRNQFKMALHLQLRYPLAFSSNTRRRCGLQLPSRSAAGIVTFSSARKTFLASVSIRAATGRLGSGSNHVTADEKPLYHPFEEITQVSLQGRDARLTSAETCRTIIEVNSKATLMFSGFDDDVILDNLFWPDLPYASDEHGNIYFMVNGDEDIMQGLASDDNMVQVVIGSRSTELLKEIDSSGLSDFDFGFEELDDEDSEIDISDDGNSSTDTDEGEGDWVTVLDDCDAITFWGGLETMEYVHPMRFADTIAEVIFDDKMDWMQQPPAGISVRGILRPVHDVDRSVFHMKTQDESNASTDESISSSAPDSENISGDGSETKERTGSGISYYKLEMVNMKLVSSHGHQATVEIEDFRNVCPDAIAHSATKIMSRLIDSGDKTTKALEHLCWRLKGIQVEEAMITGIDSLGFDLRVRCETQVQTLRFGFNTRATSEFSAERQLNELLYPRMNE